jgi:membrane associated rhomboid family serine protease
MIPLRDDIPSRSAPIVNYLMIGLCTVAFLAQLGDQSDGQDQLVERFGMIPVRVLHPDRPVVVQEEQLIRTRFGIERQIVEREFAPPPVNVWLTLLTCTFLHGGWLHFLGNMWFLHIFGDNVEDRLGHITYFLFYLACGVLASGTHLVTNAGSTMPTIGASGAIAGVMGAYMLLYPHAKVLTIIPIFYFIQTAVIPAPVFLGIWFLLQFFQGTFAVAGQQAGGVAWWAHIGGFATGFLFALMWRASGHANPPVETRLSYGNRALSFRGRRPFDDRGSPWN